jgi:hypothetical protein
MSMILAWVLLPLVLAAVGLGWGALVEWAAGGGGLGAYTIPVGLAAAIVVAALLTSWSATASAAGPVVAFAALAGLARAYLGRVRIPLPALAAGLGAFLIFGLPVILSGQATFLGYVRLDDTATWFALADQLFAHGRSVAGLPLSTFQTLVNTNLNTSAYPAGAFMILGVGHWITGIDIAWIFQPYLAVCAGALALTLYGLVETLVDGRWLAAFVAFVGAQSALLFGYAAWGGVKELTAAPMLALGVALVARLLASPDAGARQSIPLAVAGAALTVTLGPGAAVYALPALGILLATLAWRVWRAPRHRHAAVLQAAGAVALTALLALPMWLTIATYTNQDSGSYASSADTATRLGNLAGPLRALQIAGIWLTGDFRDVPNPPPSLANHLLVWVVIVAAVGGAAFALLRRVPGLAIYALVALAGALVLWVFGSTPWLIGKAIAMSSPAVLVAGAAGGAALLARRSVFAAIPGILILGAIAGGVLWSNYLQYHDVTLAPRARLAELQTIGTLVSHRQPTFFNEYEIYGDRHFLRAGAPVEPAEYRPVDLPTLGNALLTKTAWANIDAFGLQTLEPYRSLVVRVGPTESRPPSIYHLVWAGRYYQLWQQPAHPTVRVLNHYPLGDSTTDAYCGSAEPPSPYSNLCPIKPAAVPACATVRALARTASADGAELTAYQRTDPIVLRATQTQWGSSAWSASIAGATLTPVQAGASTVAHVNIPHGVRGWQLWLGGSFARGFRVSVDGRTIGSVSAELDPTGAYERVGSPLTLAPGLHTITVTYPDAGIGPGDADSEHYTYLSAIALAPPLYPADGAGELLTVSPAHASLLCGRTLDWIEIVKH